MRSEVLSKGFATGAASGAKLPFTGMSAPAGKTDMPYPREEVSFGPTSDIGPDPPEPAVANSRSLPGL